MTRVAHDKNLLKIRALQRGQKVSLSMKNPIND